MKNNLLKAYVLPIGNVNSVTGKTMYDWGIYDDNHSVFLTSDLSILVAAPTSFNIGDTAIYFHNDTHRYLSKQRTIIDHAVGTDNIKKMFIKHNIKIVNPKPFHKSNKHELKYSYSVKGSEFFLPTDPLYKKIIKNSSICNF